MDHIERCSYSNRPIRSAARAKEQGTKEKLTVESNPTSHHQPALKAAKTMTMALFASPADVSDVASSTSSNQAFAPCVRNTEDNGVRKDEVFQLQIVTMTKGGGSCDSVEILEEEYHSDDDGENSTEPGVPSTCDSSTSSDHRRMALNACDSAWSLGSNLDNSFTLDCDLKSLSDVSSLGCPDPELGDKDTLLGNDSHHEVDDISVPRGIQQRASMRELERRFSQTRLVVDDDDDDSNVNDVQPKKSLHATKNDSGIGEDENIGSAPPLVRDAQYSSTSMLSRRSDYTEVEVFSDDEDEKSPNLVMQSPQHGARGGGKLAKPSPSMSLMSTYSEYTEVEVLSDEEDGERVARSTVLDRAHKYASAGPRESTDSYLSSDYTEVEVVSTDNDAPLVEEEEFLEEIIEEEILEEDDSQL